jgi:hypothetical protein
MSETNIKNELLKQSGKSAVDQEASRLHAIIAAEQRRVRRLLFLTIGVWATWILMITLSLLLPMLSKASGPAAATQPLAASVSHAPGIVSIVFGGIVGIVVIALFIGLPIAGIVLAIMLIVSRHTASVNQVRASLASIDAQLRMLGAAGVKSDEAK